MEKSVLRKEMKRLRREMTAEERKIRDENELKICIEKAENGENIETTRKSIEGELVLSDFEEDDE